MRLSLRPQQPLQIKTSQLFATYQSIQRLLNRPKIKELITYLREQYFIQILFIACCVYLYTHFQWKTIISIQKKASSYKGLISVLTIYIFFLVDNSFELKIVCLFCLYVGLLYCSQNCE